MSQETGTTPGGAGGTGRSVGPLDEVDRRILGELVADARLSIRTLAERVHVSRTNAYARVERLLRDGVLTGFTARVAP
ncbi:AsnC family transcriptional regulator, partial [Micromonospora sp. NBS 11-29]|uniref:AsnC family transcriptional regulator n=1 Tax=Micromonospora sp. NBS 11-29 TaxID=1960879 RepID=UPI003F8EF20B